MGAHLTFRRLFAVVGVAAMACGALFAADSDWIWIGFAAYPLSLFTRRGRPMARWCQVVLALAVITLSAAGARDIDVAFLAVVATLIILLISPLLAWHRDWRRTGRSHRLSLFVAATCVAAMLSVVATSWPLHLAFLASRRDFDAFAGRLELGYQMTKPERAGRFLIRKAEMRDGRPCLWLGIDPSGFDGFVRNPPRTRDGSLQGLPNTCFNCWTALRLDDDWAFISED